MLETHKQLNFIEISFMYYIIAHFSSIINYRQTSIKSSIIGADFKKHNRQLLEHNRLRAMLHKTDRDLLLQNFHRIYDVCNMKTIYCTVSINNLDSLGDMELLLKVYSN